MDYSIFYQEIEKDCEQKLEIKLLKEKYFKTTNKAETEKLEKRIVKLTQVNNNLLVKCATEYHEKLCNEKRFESCALKFNKPSNATLLKNLKSEKTKTASEPLSKVGGGYVNGKITINESSFNDKSLIRFMSIMAHETQHAFQDMGTDFNGMYAKKAQNSEIYFRYKNSKDPIVRDNIQLIDDFFSCFSDEFYWNSITEVDARRVEDSVQAILMQGSQAFLINKQNKEIVKTLKGQSKNSNEIDKLSKKIDLVMNEKMIEKSVNIAIDTKYFGKDVREVLDGEEFKKFKKFLTAPKFVSDEHTHLMTDMACLLDIFLTSDEKKSLTSFLKSQSDKTSYIQAQIELNHVKTSQVLKEFDGKANLKELETMLTYGKEKDLVIKEIGKFGKNSEKEIINRLLPYKFFTNIKNIYPKEKDRAVAINNWVNANFEDVFEIYSNITKYCFDQKTLSKDSAKEVVRNIILKCSETLKERGKDVSPKELVSSNKGNSFSLVCQSFVNSYKSTYGEKITTKELERSQSFSN